MQLRMMDDLVHGRRLSSTSGGTSTNANASRHGLLSFVRRRWGEAAMRTGTHKAAAAADDDAHLLLKDRRNNNRRRRGRPSPSPPSSSAPRSSVLSATHLASFRSTTTHDTLPNTDSIGPPQHPGLEEVPHYVVPQPPLPAPPRTNWERNAKHPILGYLVQVEEFDNIQDAVVAHNNTSSLSLTPSYDQRTTTRPRIFFYCCNCGRYDHDDDDNDDENDDDDNDDDDDTDDESSKNEDYDLSVLIELLSDPLLVEALETLFRPVLLQTAPPSSSSRNSGADDDPVVAAVVNDDDDDSSSSSMAVVMPSIGFCDEHGRVLTSLTLFELSRASLLDALCESYETATTTNTTTAVSSLALPPYLQLLRSEIHSRPRQLTVLLRNTVADAQVQLGRLDGVLHTQPHRWTTTMLPNNNPNNHSHNNNNTDQRHRRCDDAGEEDWRGVSALTITYDSRRLSFSQVCRRVLLLVGDTGSQQGSSSSVVQIVCSSHDEMMAARLEIASSSSSSSRGLVTYRGHHHHHQQHQQLHQHHHPQVTTVAVLRTERQQQHQGGPSRSSIQDDHYPTPQQQEEQLPSPPQPGYHIRHLSSSPSYLYLHRTVLRLAPMTNLQALQMNALCRCPTHCHEAIHLLSPRQVAILRQRLQRPPQQHGSDTTVTSSSSSSVSSISLPSMIGITPLSTAWRMASLCGYGDVTGADQCAAAAAKEQEEEEEDAAPEMYHLMGRI
jgi:hypothetical protein